MKNRAGIIIPLTLAFLVCAAVAQTPPKTSQPVSYDTAIAIEDPAARITALQQILKTRPAAEQADAAREAIVASWAQLGEVELGENNIEKAVANFRKALGALPEKVTDQFFQETVIRIPLAVSVRGYRNEAVGLARQLETRFAKDTARLAALGEFFMTIEAPTDAIRALEAAAKTGEPDAHLHRALGSAYRIGLRLDDAIAEYQLAIGVDAKDKRAYYELANLYRAHGAYPDAIKLYQKQLEIEPKHAPSFKGLALTFLALGDEPQMTAALNQARDLRGVAEEITGDLYLQTQMALYYLAQNKLKQARQASETALMIEPRYAWARIAAAEVDLAEGKIFEAERNLLAAGRYASFPSLFFTFGKLYLSVEDFDGAMEQFSKAFNVSTKASKEIFSTRLGGSLDVKADSVKELLAREHQASLFVAVLPTSPEQYKLAESLTRFHTWLEEIKKTVAAGKVSVTRKQMEELDRAALDFAEAESTRRSFRSLYVAQKLSQAGIATGLAVELAEQALGLAEVATELDGSVRDYPNYDRNGRLQIFRGRALDAKGWALFQAGKTEEATASLNEAVTAYGTLPEARRAQWHLAVVKETAGELAAALDLYLSGYEPPEASSFDVKLAAIEAIYRKINNSTNGLEERLRQAGINATLVSSVAAPPEPKSSKKSSAAQTRQNAKPIKLQPKAPANAQKDSPKTENSLESGKADLSLAQTVAVNEPPKLEESAKDSAKDEKVEETKKEDRKPELEIAKPVTLPNVEMNLNQPVLLVPMVDALMLISQLENLKPVITTESEDVPPPPAKPNTRPRRVNTPTKPDNQ
ncbi:MAG: tetratricopeptide repeat protein [Acidobacteriota bacterium]|nr:tetratricopeptide repeat protein [Acidobacteriota bacterium]